MTAVCGGHPEYFLRPAPPHIFRRKEAGEIPTDDLVGSITLDSFGAGIPTDNAPPRVHHEDRVVLDSVEEHPITLLAFSERVPREPSVFHLRHELFPPPCEP